MKGFLLFLLLFPFVLCAQQLQYRVEMLSYFDNREYSAEIQQSNTLFGVRLSPDIGWGFVDNKGSLHRIMAGLSYVQPVGSVLKESTIHPTVYYQYQNSFNGLNLSLGMIPYSFLKQNLPSFLMYDSLVYMQPNIQGALMQYTGEHLCMEFLCDWRGSQTEERHEAFRIIFQGRYDMDYVSVGGIFQLNHLASREIIKEGVSDDIVLYPYLELQMPWQDSRWPNLCLQAGYIFEYEKDRKNFKDPIYCQGCLLKLSAHWRGFGLKSNLYMGDNLFPLYSYKGTLLNQGDPFYQSRMYHRTDLYVSLIRNKMVNCFFSWNFHYTKEYGLDYQQQLILRFSIDGIYASSNSLLRNIFDK